MPLILALGELLLPLLGWLARTLVVSLVARAILGLGIAFTGYHFLVGPILDAIKGQVTGLPADIGQWLGMLRFDQAITVVCSAYLLRFAVSGLSMIAKSV